ncbi:hypothetical protein R5R35_004990 [Gryllus longicercus]|uniref:Uncharacterized protein n=1 Tax=Gryllus longicercus TaxID=2509291 RepID=A0AAN9VE98_9ORTH
MDSDSSESDAQSSRLGTPPRKSRKRHYDQKYSKLWEKDKEFAGWLQESTKGEGYFYCKSGIASQLSITQFGQTHSKKSFEDKIKFGETRMACFWQKIIYLLTLLDYAQKT